MLLDGRELAEFIKERQAQSVRSFQHLKSRPHLAIVQCSDNTVSSNKEVVSSTSSSLVSSKYVKIKQDYGSDVGVDVSLHRPATEELIDLIQRLNEDDSIHGIIVQLPLPKDLDTDAVLNQVDPGKDVDGLGADSLFDPPTPTAILWLLSCYDVELKGKRVAVVGQGRLVGTPLTHILQKSGVEVRTCDENTRNLAAETLKADVIITATGQPGLITGDMVKPGSYIIDGGTSDVSGGLTGDVSKDIYARKDLKISPVPGGVGPLTVCALFENLLAAFRGSHK